MSVPQGWTSATLEDVTVKPRKTDPKLTGREFIKYVDIGGLDGPVAQLDDAPSIPSATAPSRCRQVIEEGDTVYSTVRPYLRKMAYIGHSLKGEFASTGFAVLRTDSHVLSKYLYHWCTSPRFEEEVLRFQKGVSYPAVLDRQVRGCHIDFPGPAEQRRIVDLIDEHLSHLDAADASLARCRERSQALRAASIDAMFPQGTRRKSLADLVTRIEAGRSFGAAAAPAADDEWGIIRVSAMTWGEFRPGENKRIPSHLANPAHEIHQGDLLVSRANTAQYVGAPVVVRQTRPRLLLSDKSLRIIPQRGVSSEWLCMVLSAPAARRQISSLATGTSDSMRNISQSSLRQILLPDPAVRDQLADLQRMHSVETAVTRAGASCSAGADRSAALRRAILAAAFSGRLTGHASDSDVIEETAASLPASTPTGAIQEIPL